MIGLALVLDRRGQLDEALQWLRRCAELGNAGALNELGLVLNRDGHVDAAERCWRDGADSLGNMCAGTHPAWTLLPHRALRNRR
jgi:Tetratricopeptide repeat